jgi:arylsulfatase
MALWDQVDLAQWDHKAGQAPTAVKKEFTYADLATGDDEMRAKAIDWLKAHSKDANPSLCISAFSRCITRTTPPRAGRGSLPAAATISTL